MQVKVNKNPEEKLTTLPNVKNPVSTNSVVPSVILMGMDKFVTKQKTDDGKSIDELASDLEEAKKNVEAQGEKLKESMSKSEENLKRAEELFSKLEKENAKDDSENEEIERLLAMTNKKAKPAGMASKAKKVKSNTIADDIKPRSKRGSTKKK